MPSYTDSLGFDKGSAAFDARGNTHGTKMEVVLDFAKIAAARTAAGATALTTSDTLDVLPIPAGAVVLAAGFQTTTAQASLTVSLGDSGSGTRYVSAGSTASTGWTTPLIGSSGTVPYVYTADSALRVTFGGTAPTTAVIRVWVYVIDAN